MVKFTSRRTFLRTAPVAAAISLALVDFEDTLYASTPSVHAPQDPAKATIPPQVFTAQALASDAKALQAEPGNNNLVQAQALPFTIVMTTEVSKSAKEFEWHEGRDHIVQVLEGTTLYEVGGTPKDGRQTKPGEWLAPASESSKSIILGKGDMLTIPRGTPHKRSTEDTVTFLLISPTGSLKT